MEMTRERISFTFDPRDMLLSLQMGFSFIRAAVACAILERISDLEPSSETIAPRYFLHESPNPMGQVGVVITQHHWAEVFLEEVNGQGGRTL